MCAGPFPHGAWKRLGLSSLQSAGVAQPPWLGRIYLPYRPLGSKWAHFQTRKPRLEKQLFGRLIPSPQGWGPEQGQGDCSHRHWEEERCKQSQAFHCTPVGWGGCSPGQGQRGPGPGYWERVSPTGEACSDGDCTEACGGTSTEWSKTIPRDQQLGQEAPLRPPPSCVCLCGVCVCVGQGRAPFHLHRHARRLLGRPGGGLLPACVSTAAPPAINGARSHFAELLWDWDNGRGLNKQMSVGEVGVWKIHFTLPLQGAATAAPAPPSRPAIPRPPDKGPCTGRLTPGEWLLLKKTPKWRAKSFPRDLPTPAKKMLSAAAAET